MRLEIKSKEDVLKLQESVANKLSQGDIIEKEFIFLFDKLKEMDIPKNEVISKNIDFLQKHYEKLSNDEKYLVNNLLFALDIINGEAKEGLFRYLLRGLRFNMFEAYNNLEGRFFIDYISSFKDIELLIEGVKEVFRNYFSFSYDERRKILANIIAVVWNNELLFNNPIWLEVFDILVELVHEAIDKELIEDEMPLHFLAYHLYGNNIHSIDEWRVFNEKVDKVASKFYKNWAKKNNIEPNFKGDKKKIGILIDRIILNSPFMVLYSLLKSLMEDEEFRKNYEIYVYSMEYIYKQPDDEKLIEKLQKLGVKVYTPSKFKKDKHYFSHLQKAMDLRNIIIKDEIFYLINPYNGYDISNFIFSTRTAPKQIYWSHGNCAFDIEGIDERISHFEQECSEFDWKIFNIKMADEFLVGTKKDKEQADAVKKAMKMDFGDKIILGTIGRYIKLDNEEYLKVVKKIMDENPDTIYLACGAGNKDSIEKKLEKIGIDRDRFIFTGIVNPHVFGWIIDVWLDTFPLRQGQSKDEYIAKGGVVVFMDEYLNDSIRKWYKDFEEPPIAKSKDEYINIVNRLIKDKEYRMKLSEYNEKIFADKKTNFLEVIDAKEN